MAQPLAAAAVELHVVRRPSLAEQLRAGGQFADKLDERLVVRIVTGFQPQHGGSVIGDPVVVNEELPRLFRLQVDESRGVGRATGIGEHRRIQRPSELVHRQDVVPSVAYPGRSVGHGVEHLLHRRPDPLRRRALATGTARAALPGQSEEVIAFCLVELQSAGQRVEDVFGCACEISAFHTHVVVDRDAGE
ncbi:MAG: hypothetical protein V9G10_15935 [Candidatus Nanopelagicales bacterium]